MEIRLIITLFLFYNLATVVLNDSNKEDNTANSKCDDGKCENSELVLSREKREENSQIVLADKMTFDLSISGLVVETFGLENMLKGIEKQLEEKVIDPKDVFQLEMHGVLRDEQKEQRTSFVIQPLANRESIKIASELLQAMESMRLNGIDVKIIEGSFTHNTSEWNNVKTDITFELLVDYIWMVENNLQESINQIATFLHETFGIYRRDIYDLTLSHATNGITIVEFAIPPLISNNNVSDILKTVEKFVGSCKETCKTIDDVDTGQACKTCQSSIKLFDVSIYPNPQSFIWKTERWTGNEIRYEVIEVTQTICPEHQELCIVKDIYGVQEPTCVAIGRCEKHFYRTVSLTIEAVGSIQLLDIYGLDNSKEIVADSLSSLHGICRSSLDIIFFDRGRDTFGISVLLAPSIGRTDSLEKLDEMVRTKNEIEALNLVITKVNGSYRKEYLDLNKPLSKFITNNCFGCEPFEVWCLLPNMSFCTTKKLCIDMYYQSSLFRISNTTEIIKFNLLMKSEEEFYYMYDGLHDDIKYDIIIQLAQQTNSRPEIFTYVELVSSEYAEYFELGISVLSLHNNSELQNIATNLFSLTDQDLLQIVTPAAVFTAVPETVLFRQFIASFPEPSQSESISNYLGNIVTSVSLAVIAIVVTTVLILVRICRKRRRLYVQTLVTEEPFVKEKQFVRFQQHKPLTFMTR